VTYKNTVLCKNVRMLRYFSYKPDLVPKLSIYILKNIMKDTETNWLSDSKRITVIA
jgi:hypothetical protein